MRKKRNIIIISIALVILIVLGLVIFLQLFSNVDNVTKATTSEASKLEAGNLFNDAYFDEETGTIKGLTSEEQKVVDNIVDDLKNYLSANGISDDIEEITENQIKLKLTDVDEETLGKLKDDVIQIILEELKENLGDVVTEDMITAVETNESLSNEVETGLGDALANIGGDLSTVAQAGIYKELDDEIEEQISRFIISDVGKNMVDDILSGNGADILTNFGDDLLGSVRGGLNDFMDFKITEQLFGSVGGEVTTLLTGKLDLVGKVGDIIGFDLDGVVGLPDKLIDGITGKVTDVINTDIAGDLVGGITGGLDNYIGSLGGGITSSITGSISEILTGDSLTLLGSTVLKQVNYPSSHQMSLEQISYEKLTSDPSLLCAGHGTHIPSVQRYRLIAQDDATIYDFPAWITPRAWPDVTPGMIIGSIGHNHINVSGDGIVAYNEGAYWTHMSAANPLRKVSTHTISRYNSFLRKGTVAESYILAHEKNTAFYADYVQLALWYLLGQEGNGSLGTKVQDQRIGRNLYQEAIGLQNAVIAQEAFVASNMGKKIVDQTNYWMNNG